MPAHVPLTALVVTYNSARYVERLARCLRAEAAGLALRIVVVDNDSTDDTAVRVAADPDLELVRAPGNVGYAAAINIGRRHVGPCAPLLVLNPDLQFAAGTIAVLLRALARPGVGAVVPRLCTPAGERYESLRHEPSLARSLVEASLLYRIRPHTPRGELVRRPADYERPHAVDWATGAAVLISAECDAAVGDWDEGFFLYSEETDFFRRARAAGFTVEYVPDAVIEHEIGGSGYDDALEALMAHNRVRYYRKYHSDLAARALTIVLLLHHLVRGRRRRHRRVVRRLARTLVTRDLLAPSVAPQPPVRRPAA